MNNTIWKFSLGHGTFVDIKMPKGSDLLTVEIQDGCPHLWVAVDPDRETETRVFAVYGTGHIINRYNKKKFIGTVFLNNGLVFHVFEMLH